MMLRKDDIQALREGIGGFLLILFFLALAFMLEGRL
jgi:hypothetical protein